MGKGIPVLGDRAAREAFLYGSLHTDEVTLGTWKHHVPEPSADTVLTADATGQPEWVSELPVALGGTGLDSFSIGDIIYASAANVLAALAGNATTTKKFLTQTGDGVTPGAPAWGQVSASDVQSGAALTRVNDTNLTLTLSGTPASALLAAVSLTMGWAGQLGVTRGGTGLGAIAQGDLLYGSAADTIAALAKNTSATRYLSNTGASNAPAWAQVNLANGVTGTLLETNGGTGMASYIAGDMLYAANTTTLAQLGIGASGRIISSTGSAPTWSTLVSLAIVTGALTSGRVPVASGATTLTDYANFKYASDRLQIGNAFGGTPSIIEANHDFTDPAATTYGIESVVNAVLTGNNGQVLVGSLGQASLTSANNLTANIGLRGVFGAVVHSGAGTVTGAAAFITNFLLSGGGTITSAAGLRVQSPTLTSGTITRMAGVMVGDLSGATNYTGFLIGTTTIPSANYGIYNSATADNHFAGNVGLGNVTAPACLLHIGEATLGDEVTRYVSTATNDDPQVSLYQNRIATTNATVTTLHTISIASGYSYLIETHVVARRTGGSSGAANDSAGYIIAATVKDVSGTATLVGAVTAIHTAEDQAAWDCTIDVTGATARVRVTGATNNNVTWHLSKLNVMPLSS